MERANVLIIGAGPAGIATAVELKALNVENVIVLEGKDKICAMIHNLYHDGKRVDPVYRKVKVDPIGILSFDTESKEEFLARMEKVVKDHNIDVRLNNEVYKVTRENGKFRVYTTKSTEYLANFLVFAIGIFGKPNKPSYPIPKEVNHNIFFSIPKNPPTNKKILVVGGGDTAVETACYLSEKNDVTLSYRRPEFFRINEINACNIRDLSCKGKVKLYMATDIEGIEPAENGILVKFKERESEVFEQIFYCLGGISPQTLLESVGIEFKDARPIINENCETNVENCYLAGDLAVEKGTIIAAFNTGKIIADAIKKKLTNN